MTHYIETEVTFKLHGLLLTATVDHPENGKPFEQPAGEASVTEITNVDIDDLDKFVAWLYSKLDVDEAALEEFRAL